MQRHIAFTFFGEDSMADFSQSYNPLFSKRKVKNRNGKIGDDRLVYFTF